MIGDPCDRFLYKATLTEKPAMSSLNFLPASQASYLELDKSDEKEEAH